jgi:hypothetical protein
MVANHVFIQELDCLAQLDGTALFAFQCSGLDLQRYAASGMYESVLAIRLQYSNTIDVDSLERCRPFRHRLEALLVTPFC